MKVNYHKHGYHKILTDLGFFLKFTENKDMDMLSYTLINKDLTVNISFALNDNQKVSNDTFLVQNTTNKSS